MSSSAMTLSNPKQRGSLRQPSLIHTSRSAACICQLSRRRISVPCHAFQLSLDNIYDKMEFGLKPYNFEPEYTEEELAELATASDENSGNDGSSQQTCRCTHWRFQTAIVEEEKTWLCGRSDSFQPRGLLLHNGPSILPHDCAKSDCARSCIHSEFSLQEEPCHCTSCFEQQVHSSLCFLR